MMFEIVAKFANTGFRRLLLTGVLIVFIGSSPTVWSGADTEKEDGEAMMLETIGLGQNGKEQPPMFMDPDPQFTWREYESPRENPIFKTGETLKYEVSWMGINAGTITMTLSVDSEFEGSPAYKVVVVGETSKTFSLFFKVHDVITSYMEPGSFNSYHYIKDVREGDYRKLKETHYNQVDHVATVQNETYPLPPNSKDPIACIFAVRRYIPQPGKILRLNSNSEGKSNIPVEIDFSTRAKITLDGDISRDVVMGKPLPTWEGRVFEKKQSKAIFWVTDDEYVVPLRLETKVRIGSLKAELIKREGPGWNLDLEED
ncbi:MAG TPA: DUF3108 domain-containing protein [bacterium]|nr:DUF3108 domain-containing protein [bacterium]